MFAGIGYMLFQHNNASDVNASIANNTTEKTTVKNATHKENTQQTVRGEYGYCTVCGKVLTYLEAHNEYTQGKVCYSCESNPY